MQDRSSTSSARIPGTARMLGYFPVATFSLIALNVMVYLGALPGNFQDTASWFGIIPRDLQFVTLFTSLFIHFDLAHLLVNVLFLWLFGRKVEQEIGPIEFLMFYIGSGFLASLLHVAVVMTFLHSEQGVPLVGASGAVAGVIGMYTVKFRHERMFVHGREIPTSILLIAWFLFQVALGLAGLNLPKLGKLDLRYVGYWSHIGGFIFGMTAAWVTGGSSEDSFKSGSKTRRVHEIRRSTLFDIARKYEALVGLDPEDPFAHTELGRVRAQLGDRDGSVAGCLAAVELYKAQGMPDDAVAALHETLKLWPEAALTHQTVFRIACLFELLGEPEEAASRFAWLAASAHDEQEGEMAMLKLGQIELDKLHHPDKAVQSLERLLAEHPNSRWVELAKQLLERARTASQG